MLQSWQLLLNGCQKPTTNGRCRRPTERRMPKRSAPYRQTMSQRIRQVTQRNVPRRTAPPGNESMRLRQVTQNGARQVTQLERNAEDCLEHGARLLVSFLLSSFSSCQLSCSGSSSPILNALDTPLSKSLQNPSARGLPDIKLDMITPASASTSLQDAAPFCYKDAP